MFDLFSAYPTLFRIFMLTISTASICFLSTNNDAHHHVIIVRFDHIVISISIYIPRDNAAVSLYRHVHVFRTFFLYSIE